MGVLSNNEILAALQSGALEIRNFCEDCLNPASYDIRLGDQVYLSKSPKPVALEDGGYFVLEPGEFALIKTHEEFKLPLTMIGMVGLRAKISLSGVVNLSGIQIDPGFEGPLYLGLVNLGSHTFRARHMDKLFSVQFVATTSPATRAYSGEFSRKEGIPVSLINAISQEGHGYLALPELAKRVEKIDERLNSIKNWIIFIAIPLLFTVIGAILQWLLPLISQSNR